MKSVIRLLVIFLSILNTSVFAQSSDGYEDVVYLKNGSIIRGIITEQIPFQSIKIETKDGNIFVLKLEEIEKISKEKQKVVGDSKKDKDLALAHNGFQFSMYLGGAGGDVVGKGNGIGKIVFSGGSIHLRLNLGYAINSTAFGLAFGSNSLFPEIITYRDTAFSNAGIGSIDNGMFGVYIKRYFMPINIFLSGEIGIGKFKMYDASFTNSLQSQSGIAWNIRAGKEFLIGSKKKYGLGGIC